LVSMYKWSISGNLNCSSIEQVKNYATVSGPAVGMHSNAVLIVHDLTCMGEIHIAYYILVLCISEFL
jgi:hypothetical protein